MKRRTSPLSLVGGFICLFGSGVSWAASTGPGPDFQKADEPISVSPDRSIQVEQYFKPGEDYVFQFWTFDQHHQHPNLRLIAFSAGAGKIVLPCKSSFPAKARSFLPLAARNKYHLKAGDTIQLLLKEDEMTLVPRKLKKRKGKIVIDPTTGMAALTFGPGTPIITSEMVHKFLEDFP